MNIVIVSNSKIPALKYGGTERVIWYLGHELVKMGHKVTFLAMKGSFCPFADVRVFNPQLPVGVQIPDDTDIVNFHCQPSEEIEMPYLISVHGNLPPETVFFRNSHFLSESHAARYGSGAFIYNGLDWNDYGKPDLNKKLDYVHFLGKAAWRVKNVKGAIKIAHRNKTEIKILGGSRINFKMGFRITLSRWATFYGMVGGEVKNELIRRSKALIFPVLWHEPFGLAVIESLYFGCPVLGTNYGALPELVTADTGFLSDSPEELTAVFKEIGTYKSKFCHEYARENFNSAVMAKNYLKMYEQVLNGHAINLTPPAYIRGRISEKKSLQVAGARII
jgi:glycosyltransferase involved in cell wall biosynthesis